MSEIHLFGLAARHAEWLAQRQTVIAGNIANSDTPGFKARDVASFSDVLESTQLRMSGSSPMHLAAADGAPVAEGHLRQDRWDVTHSGNTVSLEQELMKSGEVARDYQLNTSLTKAFHRMLLSTLRG